MKLIAVLPRTKIQVELADANWNRIEQLRADFAELAGDLIVKPLPSKPKRAKKGKCPVCGKMFERVNQHVSRMHKDSPAFTRRKMHTPTEGGVAREVPNEAQVRDLHEHDVPAPGGLAGGSEDTSRLGVNP